MLETFDFTEFTDKVWLTADFHFGHQHMLEVTERPWANIEKHDRALIRNACELVGKDDIFIINGDLTMKGPDNMAWIERVVSRLPGKKILVFGNHDRLKPLQYIEMGFIVAATSLVLPGGIFVAHDPAWAEVWPKDQPMLCGHVHGLFREVGNVVNVGVDVWDYKPVLLEEALMVCDCVEKKTVDWKTVSRNRHKSGKTVDW